MKPAEDAPSKPSSLAQAAMWSAAATVGVPLVWAVLTSTLGGDAGLAVGWFGVLPVILFVPLGIVATLALGIAAAVQGNRPQGAADSSKHPTDRLHDRDA